MVVAPRGRTHFFSGDGRLVSSVRYAPADIARRQKLGVWRPSGEEELTALREAVEARNRS